MNINKMFPAKAHFRVKIAVPLLAFIIVAVELYFSFYGSMALVKKNSVLVIIDSRAENKEELGKFLERELALTGAFSVKPLSMIERYLNEKADRELKERFTKNNLTRDDYAELAKILSIERVAFGSYYEGSDSVSLYVSIINTEDGKHIAGGYFSSLTAEDLLTGEDGEGEKLDFLKEMDLSSKGISLDGWLFFLLMGTILSAAVAIFLGKTSLFFIEGGFYLALFLFLFDFIFALNADLDYVQRFILEGGNLNLAANSRTQQLHSFLRYGPFIGYFGLLYGFLNTKRRLKKPIKRTLRSLPRFSSHWALPSTLFAAAAYAMALPSAASLKSIFFLAWIAMIPLYWILLGNTFLRSCLHLFFFSLLSILFINYWQGTYDYVSLPFALVILNLQALIYLPLWITLTKRAGKWGFLVGASLWVLLEYLRSLGFIGYPWGLLGASQYPLLPLIQIADITGIWGVSFLVALASAAIAYFFWGGWGSFRRSALFFGGVAGMPILIALIYGIFVLNRDFSDGEVVRLSLVQPNTDPRKYDDVENYAAAKRQTQAALKEWGGDITPDLIIWPEGGTNFNIRLYRQEKREKWKNGKLLRELLNFHRSTGTWLITGSENHSYIKDEDGEDKRLDYNASYLIDPKGDTKNIYHKIKLVPFTEHFPYKKEFPWIEKILSSYEAADWTPGTELTLLENAKFSSFTPICYEDVFPDHVRRFVLEGGDIITNISNDYWALTPTEGRQHGVHALFRAVENRRPLTRTSTSGMTAYIDVYGRIVAEAPYYKEAYLNVEIPLPQKEFTIYTRFGDWFPGFLFVLTVITLAIAFVSSKRKE